MSRKGKLYSRILNNQKNINFRELQSLVEAFGFELDRIDGSHHTYKHPRVPDAFLQLQPDKNGKAKPYQVKQFLNSIEQYNLHMDAGED